MSPVHHRYPYQGREKRSDRVTIWLLAAVVVATFLALTFGTADGFFLS